jgi:hypothetical protein
MTALVAPLPAWGDGLLLAKLTAVVRLEFRDQVIRVASDDPVFGRGCCEAAGCPRSAWARQLCQGHYLRWRRDGQPDLATFMAATGPIKQTAGSEQIGRLDLRSLRSQARLEIGYVLQCRQDDRARRLLPSTVRHLIGLLADADADSLLDRPLQAWLDALAAKQPKRPARTIGLVRYAWGHLCDLAEGADAETEFARDTWRAEALGLPVARSPRQIHFAPIVQTWLRTPAKRWARFRLGAGKTFGTVHIDVRALRWFSRFLAEAHPEIVDEAGLTRDALEHYLSWLGASDLAGHTKSTYLVCLRSFLAACRRHGWLMRLSAQAAIYLDELPRRPQPLPRFVPEFVMTQLADPDRLALLPDDTTRNLVIVLIETGLRSGDACALPFNDHRRQRRLALPALSQHQDGRRAARAAVSKGRRRDPRPTGPPARPLARQTDPVVPRRAGQP